MADLKLKFRSAVTYFAGVAPDKRVFKGALEKYFCGEPDPLTLERLGRCNATDEHRQY